MPVADELHVPPEVAELSVAVAPAQTDMLPVMPLGSGLTVRPAILLQPLAE